MTLDTRLVVFVVVVVRLKNYRYTLFVAKLYFLVVYSIEAFFRTSKYFVFLCVFI